VFDLPTDKLAAENKNAPEKYQGLSSGILRRALQRQSSIADDVISAFVDDVIEALLSDDLDNVKQAKPAFKGFM
jgi:hypothetical protein